MTRLPKGATVHEYMTFVGPIARWQLLLVMLIGAAFGWWLRGRR